MQKPTLGHVFPIRTRTPPNIQQQTQLEQLKAQITILMARTESLAAKTPDFAGFNADGSESPATGG